MPRFTGTTNYQEERRAFQGYRYSPVDRAVAWLPTGSIVVGHLESYSEGDTGMSSCEGSGLFVIGPDKEASPVVVDTTASACEAVSEWNGEFSVDDQGASIHYLIANGSKNLMIANLTLATHRVDTITVSCNRSYYSAGLGVGRHLLISARCDQGDGPESLFLLDSAKQALRRVHINTSQSVTNPTWDPRGNGFALRLEGGSGPEIGVFDSTGRVLARIPSAGTYSWSPDGTWLVFTRRVDLRESLWLAHPDGTEIHQVFKSSLTSTYETGWGMSPEGDPGGPIVWSPDGSEILFGRVFARGVSIWRLNLATGAVLQVTESAGP